MERISSPESGDRAPRSRRRPTLATTETLLDQSEVHWPFKGHQRNLHCAAMIGRRPTLNEVRNHLFSRYGTGQTIVNPLS